ncbi:MAG: bifunctional UDP-N-acetylglucosamine diphosphorylase/glucosamine-1-phosphate N-acetyltransferase GlmU [Thiocapsa sp.]|jgi:bifunctional UDP-N-acetylglucosamine pyrophosphorylase/glucosamine-1-phosphate N-acetyltransferase|nr:bifunctional UDP-N-acetylglucosamine diphosphorylase/glucosamine-1-phosphate N-acetyltransferase GlmU [Thiocapsa sp.]MCG6896338.1 bifunctional UDP-N-acetylglucosamine diphosphorylase/glucosamine-1-phosphate N-acetyltransferase GlmU [Thiocapsa sp.]MCG6984026.1 bifunctional UDP-N-acetylglucosamine diphosphorylase/glucosamine-1-phosphate N-acetyltransferase GlmU [Thiocapsa sp.]
MRLGVVVLAAGLGKRMRSRLPKVLHPLGGQPLLSHVLEKARQLGAARIVTVYGHGGQQVRDALAGAGCVWVEQAEQLGTGHAVIQAMPQLADVDRVLVLYGDVPLISVATLARLISVSADTGLGVLTADVPAPAGYGRVLRDAHGRVTGIVEEKDATPDQRAITEVNTGILIAERTRLVGWLARLGNDNVQGEYYLTDVTGLAAAEGVAVATTHPARLTEVAGVNDRVQLAALERDYQRHAAEELMRAGVTLADPGRFDLRGTLHAEQDVSIDVNVVIEGEVRLSGGVRIGPNCLLKDCRIGPATQVLANSVIEGAQIGADARVGPFARVRPETRLADQTHVGNFVEIKKTSLGVGSKANHLTYLGDAEIGAGVNVGAGTITCNYDGVNKSVTRIEDRAFIGSNSALVAPVTVGAGATIGAGSVITRDTPAEELTLTRAPQVTIPGWQRPKKRPSS